MGQLFRFNESECFCHIYFSLKNTNKDIVEHFHLHTISLSPSSEDTSHLKQINVSFHMCVPTQRVFGISILKVFMNHIVFYISSHSLFFSPQQCVIEIQLCLAPVDFIVLQYLWYKCVKILPVHNANGGHLFVMTSNEAVKILAHRRDILKKIYLQVVSER